MNIAKALIGEIVCEVIWDVWDMKGEKLVRMLKRDGGGGLYQPICTLLPAIYISCDDKRKMNKNLVEMKLEYTYMRCTISTFSILRCTALVASLLE
jgi:hypothetical protein